MQSEMGTATTCQFGSSGSPFGPPRSAFGAPGSLSETPGSPFGSSWCPFGSSRHPFCFSWIPFGYLLAPGVSFWKSSESFCGSLWYQYDDLRGHKAYDQAHWGAEGLKNEYSGSNGPECKKYCFFLILISLCLFWVWFRFCFIFLSFPHLTLPDMIIPFVVFPVVLKPHWNVV